MQQIVQSHSQLFGSPGVAVRLQTVPLLRRNPQPVTEHLRQASRFRVRTNHRHRIIKATTSIVISTACRTVSATPPPDDWEQALTQLEQELAALKARYAQVQQARTQQAQLRQREEHLREHLRRHKDQEAQAELQRLQEQLAQLAVTLESQLLTWSSLKQPFWQAVRFGGLGFLLGVALHHWRS